MKRIPSAVVIACAAACVSCTSARIPVPGERQTQIESVSAEYLTIADAYADLGKYDKAASYYELAMREKSLYWAAYYKLGRTYALAKKWTEAKVVYGKLLDRDPDNINLQLSLAYITSMSGDTDGGFRMYQDLAEKNPDNQDVLVNYIAVLIFQGRGEMAEEQLAVLKDKFPDNSSIKDFKQKISGLLSDDGSAAEEKEDPAAKK